MNRLFQKYRQKSFSSCRNRAQERASVQQFWKTLLCAIQEYLSPVSRVRMMHICLPSLTADPLPLGRLMPLLTAVREAAALTSLCGAVLLLNYLGSPLVSCLLEGQLQLLLCSFQPFLISGKLPGTHLHQRECEPSEHVKTGGYGLGTE